MINYYVIFLVVLFVVLFLLHRGKSSTAPVVYGSMRCPHCRKLRETIGNHEFVDCDSQKCPDFVEAYPTTVYPNGEIKVGA